MNPQPDTTNQLIRYQCTCGNTALVGEGYENDLTICGGCETPNWQPMDFQLSYKVGEPDYFLSEVIDTPGHDAEMQEPAGAEKMRVGFIGNAGLLAATTEAMQNLAEHAKSASVEIKLAGRLFNEPLKYLDAKPNKHHKRKNERRGARHY